MLLGVGGIRRNASGLVEARSGRRQPEVACAVFATRVKSLPCCHSEFLDASSRGPSSLSHKQLAACHMRGQSKTYLLPNPHKVCQPIRGQRLGSVPLTRSTRHSSGDHSEAHTCPKKPQTHRKTRGIWLEFNLILFFKVKGSHVACTLLSYVMSYGHYSIYPLSVVFIYGIWASKKMLINSLNQQLYCTLL